MGFTRPLLIKAIIKIDRGYDGVEAFVSNENFHLQF